MKFEKKQQTQDCDLKHLYVMVFNKYINIFQVLAVCLLSEGQRLYLHWSHKVNAKTPLLVPLCCNLSYYNELSSCFCVRLVSW